MNPFQRQIKTLSQPHLFESMCSQKMRPITVDVHPTLLCASKCKNCVCAPVLGKKAKLTSKRLEKAIVDYKSINVKALTVTGGGEPLMAPMESLEPIFNSELSLGLNTSLSCGESGIRALLTNIDRFTWVRISFDAYDKESYIRRRRYKDFDKIMARICRLLEATGPQTTIGIGVLIDQEIFDNLGSLLSTLKENIPNTLYGKIGYILLRPYIRHFLSDNIDYTFVNQLINEFPVWVKAFKAEGFPLISHEEKFEEIDGFINDQKNREASFCYGSSVNMVLGADGFYYRCCELAYQARSRVAHVEEGIEQVLLKYENHLRLNTDNCPLFCKHHITNEFIHKILSYDSPHKDFF